MCWLNTGSAWSRRPAVATREARQPAHLPEPLARQAPVGRAGYQHDHRRPAVRCDGGRDDVGRLFALRCVVRCRGHEAMEDAGRPGARSEGCDVTTVTTQTPTDEALDHPERFCHLVLYRVVALCGYKPP